MLKMKHRRMLSLLSGVTLLILAVFLAACGSEPEVAAVPVGLRSAAVDDLLEVSAGEAVAATEATTAGSAGAQLEQATETESSLAPAAVGESSTQAQVQDRSQHVFDPQTMADLNDVEAEGLAYMREEEKLARDVYLALYDQWGQPVFQNIAASEQAHMDSVLLLLEQAGLADPAAGLDVGQFNNPLFQTLYDDLLAQGSLSQVDALIVGATIEELDIVDLQERLAGTTNEAIIQVYSNLLSGSENHLRAFVSNLERQGGQEYQPVYLDQNAFEAILAGTAGQGNGAGGNNAGGNGNGYRGGNGSSGGNGYGRQNGRNNGV